MYKLNGNILTLEELETILQKRMCFVQYHAFHTALPKEWNTYMNLTKKNYNIKRPLQIEWLTKDKKGGQNIRRIWSFENRTTPPICQERWEDELNIAESMDWQYTHMLPFKCRRQS